MNLKSSLVGCGLGRTKVLTVQVVLAFSCSLCTSGCVCRRASCSLGIFLRWTQTGLTASFVGLLSAAARACCANPCKARCWSYTLSNRLSQRSHAGVCVVSLFPGGWLRNFKHLPNVKEIAQYPSAIRQMLRTVVLYWCTGCYHGEWTLDGSISTVLTVSGWALIHWWWDEDELLLN